MWVIGLGQNRFLQAILILTKQKNKADAHWIIRPLKVLYSLFGLICAAFSAMLILYIFNDWMMITFILLLFVGIVWGSKQYLPQYYEQIKMTLNLGAVRENERVIFEGIAWRVKSLGFYARLVNPALSGGSIRIHTKDLLNSYSRPVGEYEAWFPTKNNDWVDLSDGIYGKVILQTQEHVAIKLVGTEVKYIPTQEFLKLNPVNLSGGFSVVCVLGVDYAIQKNFFEKVIPLLRTGIKSKLHKNFDSLSDKFLELSLELLAAGASSLDLRLFIRCDGVLASRKDELERKCVTYFVEVCNEHDFSIPFNQLQVHISQ